ncbi:cell division protein ZapE [Anaplasma platys]|uniref:Cell division protein ZapE n=1 Tax=Anaplasma platys TaxID=949 RepID=A0A858PXN9_9RICK|nr:cell division protein ZapE [Anaplasma platys]QJC27337.1 cell division protein ZapE [Anaplasma platys]
MDRQVKGALERYNEMVDRNAIMFDELQVNVLRSLEGYAHGLHKWWKFWQQHPALPKRGVYLYGDVGRGKSLVVNLFYECCGIEHKRRMHYNTLMKQVHDLLHLESLKQPNDADQMMSVMDRLVGDCSLLYLDEMQVRDVCEAVILHRVFRILFSRNMIILMTSNYHPNKLYEDGIQRELFLPAIDLIMEKMEVISLSGNRDYREVKGSEDRGRFYIGNGADEKLRKHFAYIVGSAKAKQAVVILGSRRVELGMEHEGIVYVCFDDLCGGKNPMWAADYKEIARSFHTIFIENIPVFGHYSQNEMHRFIVLIDELYESKSRLFCSLSTEINMLYDGMPTVDIKRAMSRLQEMSSAAW